MGRLARFTHDVLRYSFSTDVPLLYYTQKKNVGDLISRYLVERITGRRAFATRSRVIPQISAVGSTIQVCGKRTLVWGSGSIDGRVSRHIDTNKVFALRGKKTMLAVERLGKLPKSLPLGDPAILMPHFYSPRTVAENKVGIIPHFDEIPIIRSFIPNDAGIQLISVHQEPEQFIEELASCSAVMSSSLHGLILADCYEIPNTWFSASNFLTGGRWKFQDYYSCTTKDDMSPTLISNRESLLKAIEELKQKGRVAGFTASVNDLRDSFPMTLLHSK